MKTAELTGHHLDLAVAMSQGWNLYTTDSVEQGQWYHTNQAIAPHGHEHNRIHVDEFRPSIDWRQGWLIIEREDISIVRLNDLYFPKGNEDGVSWEEHYVAYTGAIKSYGPAPLIAAMRCYVESKLGKEIELPKE